MSFSETLSSRQRGLIALALVTSIVHLLLLAYDVSNGFQAFLWGDRGVDRWEVFQALLRGGTGSYLSFMANARVGPGEYIFQLPAYLIAGSAGVIVFQIVLAILSCVCVFKIAARLLPWKQAPLICGLLYAFLPQSLVFPHQFVTEAIATPFCVFFIYFYVESIFNGSRFAPVKAGLCLGAAIFVRPSLALALPPLLILPAIYSSGCRRAAIGRALAVSIIAFLPIAVWMAAFTYQTGKVGYTSGVANLGWNLRSKVFLVYSRNGLTEPPEVARFTDYSQLYDDPGSITVGRYLQIASEHPLLFAKDSGMAAAAVFGRGNITKFLVDYLGIARGKDIKNLHNVLLKGGLTATLDSLNGNFDVILVLIVEMVFSLLVLCSVLMAASFLAIALIRPHHIRSRIGAAAFQSVLAIGAVFVAVILSSQLVDEAQGRLRSPIEASLIILCGMSLAYFWKSQSNKAPLQLPQAAK